LFAACITIGALKRTLWLRATRGVEAVGPALARRCIDARSESPRIGVGAPRRIPCLLAVGRNGERNFDQLVNRHRIRDACRLLEDPVSTRPVLEISGSVGCASLGPFDRAFKAATGLTPSASRAGRMARDAAEREASLSRDTAMQRLRAHNPPAIVVPGERRDA
jgi:AraC-like DNA-binding protein